MNEYIPISIIIGWLSVTFIYGYLKTRKASRDVEEWFVAGRRLGLIVLWLSLGANIYSSYTFLGLPGLAAREGFSVLGVFLYGMIGYIIGFWLIPILWRGARDRGWLTLADAYQDLYGSRMMGVFAAFTSALWSIPYIQLQLQGMGYIIQTCSYEKIDHVTATIIAFIILAIIVTIGGLVSVTSINVLQGAIMLIAIWVVGLVTPLIVFNNGYTDVFNTLSNTTLINQTLAKYNISGDKYVFHLAPNPLDYIYFYTLIAAAPLGFWLWPNRVQNLFAAKDEKTVKKNMILTSIYQLSQLAIIMVGLTASAMFLKGMLDPAKYPIYKKEIADSIFMIVARQVYDPVTVGFIGAAGLAASLSTAAAILHSSGALFARNIALTSDREKLLKYAKIFTMSIALISLALAIYTPGALVYLLLAGYAGIIQLFPEYLIALKKPEYANKYIAIAASSTGMATVLFLQIYKVKGLYEGFVGLMVNLLVLITLTILWKKIYMRK